MGFNDIPPAHVSPWYQPVYNATFGFAGLAWTLCYILYARQGLRTKSYGMPLFALANNFAWEMVYALSVADAPREKTAMVIWMLIDIPIIYSTLRYGREEWSHAQMVSRNLGKILVTLVMLCAVAHWSFASWWMGNRIAMKSGKFYRGIEGQDATEMAFWAVSVCQVIVSTSSLAQLVTRQHTGGVSWSIWLVHLLSRYGLRYISNVTATTKGSTVLGYSCWSEHQLWLGLVHLDGGSWIFYECSRRLSLGNDHHMRHSVRHCLCPSQAQRESSSGWTQGSAATVGQEHLKEINRPNTHPYYNTDSLDQ